MAYLCDPKKNAECPKTRCFYNEQSEFRICRKTNNPQCAKLDADGKPMEAPNFEELPEIKRTSECATQEDMGRF